MSPGWNVLSATSRRPQPLRWRFVLVLPASTTCRLRRLRRHPPPRHAVLPVAVLVLGPPMLPTPRVISVWSTARLRQEATGMLYVRLLWCRLAPLPAALGLAVPP